MKLFQKLSVLSAAVGLAAVTVVDAKPMNTCSAQEGCISIVSQEMETASKCRDFGCEFEVCLTLSMQSRACPSTISHICEKDEDECIFTQGFSTAAEKATIPAQHKQCQTVGPEMTVEFLLKDGSGCGGSGSVGLTGTGAIGGPATCQPRPASITSCTGNGVGKECIWTYTTPKCTGGGSGPTPTDAPTPAPTDAPRAERAEIVATPTDSPLSVGTADITVEKSVNLGGRSGASCNPGMETVSSENGASVTYTFIVSNTGTTCLDNVVLRDDGLGFSVPFPGMMHPGAEHTRCFQTKINGDQSSNAYVYGNPVECDTGNDIAGLSTVDDFDPAGVKQIANPNGCMVQKEVTDLPNGQFVITETETCRQCDCPAS